MPTLPLPRTRGCLVCGRDNPHGLRLRLHVDDATGVVSTTFPVDAHHAGFTNVSHGGLIATVADEAMAWASAWGARRFGLCGELLVRFRRPALVGMTLRVEAKVETNRPRLVTTSYRCVDADGHELSTGSAKYVPMSPHHNAAVIDTFLEEPDALAAARRFLGEP